ncbi:MAG: hypothetical protein AB9915_03010 [Candidatus Dojkabacteria bacterium]
MFLSNQAINQYIQEGKIKIVGDTNIESMGITVNLGDTLLIPFPNQTIDSLNPVQPQYTSHNLLQSPYTLKPNEFVLGSTKQSIQTDREIVTMIDGRSTFARLGITVHISATVLDGVPFSQEISVLEIKNLGNFDVVLHAGEQIGTYIFAQLSSPIEGERFSKYTNQNTVTPPNIT